jgi:hypothetical protein
MPKNTCGYDEMRSNLFKIKKNYYIHVWIMFVKNLFYEEFFLYACNIL